MYKFSKLCGFLQVMAVFLIESSDGQLSFSLYRTQFDKFKITKDAVNFQHSCARFGGSKILTSPLTSSTLTCECSSKSSTFGLFGNVMRCYNFAWIIGEEGCDVSLKDYQHLKDSQHFYLLNTTDKCVIEEAYYLTCGGNLDSLDYDKTNISKQFGIDSALGPNNKKGFALKVESSVYREHEGQIIKLDLKCDRKDRSSTCLMFKVQGNANCAIQVPKLMATSAPTPSADYFQPAKRKTSTSFAPLRRKSPLPSSPIKTFSTTTESLDLIPTSNSNVTSSVAKDENILHSIPASVNSIISPKPGNKVPQDKRASGTLSVPVLGAIAGTLVSFVIVIVFVVRWKKFRKQSKTLGAQGEDVGDYAEISNRQAVFRSENRASQSNQGDYATVEVPIPKKTKPGESYQSLGTESALDGSYARLYNSPKEPRRMNQNGNKSSSLNQEKASKVIPEINHDYFVLEGPDPNIQKVGEPLYHVLETTALESTVGAKHLANHCNIAR